MPATPIENWIVCISGYLQRRGQTDQGVPSIAHELYARYGGRARVEFEPWNCDWAGIAEWIFRTSYNNGTRPRIMLVAYSWGVGYGAVQLLKQLRYRGLKVQAAIFSDGVFHLGGANCHRVGLSQVLAYLPWRWGWQRPIIRLPVGVIDGPTHWFIQDNFEIDDRNTWLRGHELQMANGNPLPGREAVEGTTHRYMDEAPRFKARVMEVAESLFGEI